MLALDRRVDVLDRQALGLEPHGVVPHAHAAVAEALQLDLADALDRLQLRADHVPDVVGDEGGRAAARDREPHRRLVLGVRLADDRGVDAARQPVLRLRDLALDVLHRHVDVALEARARS